MSLAHNPYDKAPAHLQPIQQASICWDGIGGTFGRKFEISEWPAFIQVQRASIIPDHGPSRLGGLGSGVSQGIF